MNPFQRRISRKLLAFDTPAQMLRNGLLWLLMLGAMVYAGHTLYWRYLYTYTPATMTTLSSKTQTYCVGRYLIDLPTELGKPRVGLTQFYYGLDMNFKTVEVQIKPEDYDRASFERAAAARLAELKTTQNEELKIALLLHSETVKTPNGDALLLRFLENSHYKSAQIDTELIVLIGQRYIVLTGSSSPPEELVFADLVTHKFIDPKPTEDRLKHIAQNLRSYTDPLKAPEGFCLDGVVFNDKTMGYDEEKSSFAASLPSLGVRFEVHMAGKTGQDQKSLFQRLERKFPELQAAAAEQGEHVRLMRKAELQLNGMRFQDWSDEYIEPSKGNLVTHSFSAENVMASLSLLRPSIALEFSAGWDKSSPFTAEQATHIWDAALKSLRLSPANGGA